MQPETNIPLRDVDIVIYFTEESHLFERHNGNERFDNADVDIPHEKDGFYHIETEEREVAIPVGSVEKVSIEVG